MKRVDANGSRWGPVLGCGVPAVLTGNLDGTAEGDNTTLIQVRCSAV